MNKQKVSVEKYIPEETYEEMISKNQLEEDLDLCHIDNVFTELKDSKFEIVKTEPFLDELKIFVRGAVTRIGAYSNIGKSKLAYWLCIKLLKNNYSGAVFSTEVSRHTVLANLICIIDFSPFWKVVGKIVQPSDNAKKILSNLQIYDGRHGVMFLENIRDYVIANNGALDFIIVDFCQNIKDYQCSRSEYEQMSNYALEIQQLAQAFDILVIDISQLANSSVKEDFEESGFIAFKGSGALYASADIGIMLKRNKVDNPDFMELCVRKHKFFSTGKVGLGVDFNTGNFKYKNPALEINGDTKGYYNIKK